MKNTLKTDTHELIDTLARKATAGTLKRIYTASANDNIRRLQISLQADFNTVDNGLLGDISEAYDLYTAAYTYLYEQIAINGLDPQNSITKILKNGTEKTRTVFQWACVVVRKEVYTNKAIENNGQYVYIEDLKTSDIDTAADALDRHYIRMDKYNGIATEHDNERYNEMLTTLDLTVRQRQIVTMRMQGQSLTAIAKKLSVTPQTLNTQLNRIRDRAIQLFPETIKLFDLDKHSR